jgi:predicted small secreted protein
LKKNVLVCPMKTTGIIFPVLFALICLLAACGSGTAPGAGTDGPVMDRAVALINDSSVRVEPFFFSTPVGLLNKGDQVEIINRSAEKTRIGKVEDYWYQIRLNNGITGWSFGGNLRLYNH